MRRKNPDASILNRSIKMPNEIAKALRVRTAQDGAPSINQELLWILTGVKPPLEGFSQADCAGAAGKEDTDGQS